MCGAPLASISCCYLPWLVPCVATVAAATALVARRRLRRPAALPKDPTRPSPDAASQELRLASVALAVESWQLWGLGLLAAIAVDGEALSLDGVLMPGTLGLTLPLYACGTAFGEGEAGLVACGAVLPCVTVLLFGVLGALGFCVELSFKRWRRRPVQVYPELEADGFPIWEGEPFSHRRGQRAKEMALSWAKEAMVLLVITWALCYASFAWATLRAVGCVAAALGEAAALPVGCVEGQWLMLVAGALPANAFAAILVSVVLYRAGEGPKSLRGVLAALLPTEVWMPFGLATSLLVIIFLESPAVFICGSDGAARNAAVRIGFLATQLALLAEVLMHFRHRWSPRSQLLQLYILLRMALIVALHGLATAPRGDLRFVCAVEVAGAALLGCRAAKRIATRHGAQFDGCSPALRKIMRGRFAGRLERMLGGRPKGLATTMQKFGAMALQVATGDPKSFRHFYASLKKDDIAAIEYMGRIMKRAFADSEFVSFAIQVSTQWAFAMSTDTLGDSDEDGHSNSDYSTPRTITNSATNSGMLSQMTPQFVKYNSLDKILAKPPPMLSSSSGTLGSLGSLGSSSGRGSYGSNDRKAKSRSSSDIIKNPGFLRDCNINSKSAEEVLRIDRGPNLVPGLVFDPTQFTSAKKESNLAGTQISSKPKKGTPARLASSTSAPADSAEESASSVKNRAAASWVASERLLSQMIHSSSSGAEEQAERRRKCFETVHSTDSSCSDYSASAGASVAGSRCGEDVPTSSLIHEAIHCLTNDTDFKSKSSDDDGRNDRSEDDEAWEKWRQRRAKKRASNHSRSLRSKMQGKEDFNPRSQSRSSHTSYTSFHSTMSKRSVGTANSGKFALPQQYWHAGTAELAHHGGDDATASEVEEVLRTWD